MPTWALTSILTSVVGNSILRDTIEPPLLYPSKCLGGPFPDLL